MDHHPLAVVMALYSVAMLQFHLAQNAAAESGGLPIVPGSAEYESGSSVDYHELMNMVMTGPPNTENDLNIEVQAGSSGTGPITGTYDNNFCDFYVHEVELHFRGCVTTYPAISCSGRCHTEQRPNYYYTRQDARVPDPHITTCKCCSVVRYGIITLPLTMDCPNNSTIDVYHTTTYARDCGCTTCY